MSGVHRIGFTKLSGSENAGNDAPRVNIIFVHGLRGHPEETWTSTSKSGHKSTRPSKWRQNIKSMLRPHSSPPEADGVQNNANGALPKVFWPRDLLAQDSPQASVWTYGYNAEVIKGVFQANNRNGVSQHGRDLAAKFERDIENEAPVIFVAHSLGGIIVKDAIRRSGPCRLRTKLIVFLGTPHRGSEMAGWGETASNLARLALQDSNKKIVEALEVDSEVLDNINEEFTNIVDQHRVQIHSFQEARGISGMKGLHEKVVSDFSSKLGLPRSLETVESIDANHMQMVRSDGRADDRYRAISGVLKKFLRQSLLEKDTSRSQQSISQGAKPPSTQEEAADTEERGHITSSAVFYSIPFLRNRRFIGREAKLKEIEEKLLICKDCQKLAVVGLGGTGKTQIALQFAYNVKERWPGYSIFWIAALSAETFEQGCRDIVRVCSIRANPGEDPKSVVQRHLSSDAAGKWLLIVDNSDEREILFGKQDRSASIVDYLPQNENGMTLFTTRYGEMAASLAGSDTIEVEQMDPEEAEALKTSLKGVELLHNSTIIIDLLEELSYLPLAITQAVAYMNSLKLPIQDYLQLLRNRDQDTLSLLSREFYDSTRYKKSKNAIAATWLVSFDQIRLSDPVAADILSFISCIENKAIPRSILPPAQSKEEMTHAIGTLCAYAFITRRGDSEHYDMHRLVHLATQIWLKMQDSTVKIRETAVAQLEDIFPSSEWSNRAVWREYLPHTLRLLQTTEGSDKRSDLCFYVAKCLRVDGRREEAITWLSQCRLWREKHLAEDQPDMLTILSDLSSVLLSVRRIKEAISLIQHVVETKKRVLAEDDHSRLISESQLAVAFLADGQIKGAIALLEHVIVVYKRTLMKEEHPGLLASQCSLARALLKDGQVKKAVELLEQVIPVQERVLSEDHPYRLTSQYELARALLKDGQVKKAVELFEHVVAVRERVLTEDHPDCLISQHELARAFLEDGQVTRAIELLKHVVKVRERVLAESHGDRLNSQHSLAGAFLKDGQVTKAVGLLKHVVEVEEKVLPEDHPDLLAPQHELARAYEADGQIGKAISLLEHVVSLEKKLYAEDYPARRVSAELLSTFHERHRSNKQRKKRKKKHLELNTQNKPILVEE